MRPPRWWPVVLIVILGLAACTALSPRLPFPPAESARPAGEVTAATERIARAIDAAVRDRDGTYGVVVERVGTGERAQLNPERQFPSASVYKLFLAYEVLRRVDRGELELDQRLRIEASDAVEGEPEGGLERGREVSVQHALAAMMRLSSNSAAHALLRQIGRRSFNAALAQAGMSGTRVPLRGEASAPWDQLFAPDRAVTAPRDAAHLLRELAADRLLSPSSRGLLRELLAMPERDDPLLDALPDDARVLSKTGNLSDVRSVAGLFTADGEWVILCVLNEGVDPGEAGEAIVSIAREVREVYLSRPSG